MSEGLGTPAKAVDLSSGLESSPEDPKGPKGEPKVDASADEPQAKMRKLNVSAQKDRQFIIEQLKDILPTGTDPDSVEGAILWHYVEKKFCIGPDHPLYGKPMFLYDEHGRAQCRRDPCTRRRRNNKSIYIGQTLSFLMSK